MGTTRYSVEWTCWADAEIAAKRAGMKAGGEIADFVYLGEFDRDRVFPSFALAAAFAKKVRPQDVWNCPRVRRQQLVENDHDDLGNSVQPMPSFETDATWEIFEDGPTPSESAPDWLAAA